MRTNLPNGITERDLPGSSRGDQAYDWWMENHGAELMPDEDPEEAFADWMRTREWEDQD